MSCNKVFVDLTQPVVLIPNVTFASTLPHTRPRTFYLTGSSAVPQLSPYDPAWAGIPLAVQTAWNDKGTGALLLSSAASTRVPALPLADYAAARRAVVWAASTTATAGTLRAGASTTFWDCPACRYTH